MTTQVLPKPQNKSMKSQEIQTTNPKTTAPLSSDTTSHRNPKSKTEPMTQIQADSILTREQLPGLAFRIAVNVVILAILLFVASLYYGIINP